MTMRKATKRKVQQKLQHHQLFPYKPFINIDEEDDFDNEEFKSAFTNMIAGFVAVGVPILEQAYLIDANALSIEPPKPLASVPADET